ncbi:MAG: hypothetical protein A3D34_00860 [Candidatus Staskawiczbacteria bacterium RIFCSPHIGHO2_02_FULL_33_16]|uniref:Uncharacterized protein n=1 Tax=Candidatus Staskawiczbacteria bacterium RIFCSPHIGHO2_02_FULL_33_16 TaxID=1802204 RepID=A0A1G2HYN3_9BACT|nr:MAG: hypothetical protein A3D34_00860 [Candidatus Staskawiczbacteria bacterium RIFCSPHIGHO2_02_FULL_33_16]OGZ70474.1 MAG: hypothetical protein A2980_00785 [Candidatus Staskawiczbacteria bacterium RIFCSPLOWO2_01_FULL_33_13]
MIIAIDTIKLVSAVFAIILVIFGAFLPYLRDILVKKTKPHAYTWLIWTITQGVALAGLLYGKGGWGSLSFFIMTAFVFITFLVSLKYGTRNITKFDTTILIIALLSIIVWRQMQNPLLAVFIVSAIDFLGYLPSFRKTFEEPWTETVTSWLVFSFTNILIIFSLSEYNFLTLTYLITITIGNIILITICLIRRQVIPANK